MKRATLSALFHSFLPEQTHALRTQPSRRRISQLYVNRELAWLAFNERVLDQAKDASWPLLERLKFLAILGSNLDEFFMIRVSGLHEQLESRALSTAPDGLTAVEQLTRIRTVVSRLTHEAVSLWLRELLPELTKNEIRVRPYAELAAEQQTPGEHDLPSDAQLRTWSIVSKAGSNGGSLLPAALEAARLVD